MHVFEAEFQTSGLNPGEFPVEERPEIAFAGRSNVGKSSLMNRLLNRKKLVRVSKTPGCTRRINFFSVNKMWWFVDLPGYGFAKVARKEQNVWQAELGDYLASRRQLRAVILLLDLRRGLTDLDRMMLEFLDAHAAAYLPVATKVDKLKSNARSNAMRALKKELQETARLAVGPPVGVSSLSGGGIPDLWVRLNQLLGEGGMN